MNNGWIRLYRKIRDNPMWKKKPFSKGQAWVDLLLRANHKEGKVIVGTELIEVLPGQIFTSEKHLSEDWGWSRHKVANFLNALAGLNRMQTLRKSSASCQIGTPKRTSKYTIITLTNWELYQSDDSEKDIKKDIKRTSKGHKQECKE